MKDDGGVKVINRGYSAKDKTWNEAEGKVYFVGSPDEADLNVSLFVTVKTQSDRQCRINSNPDDDFLSVQSGLAL
jgi:apolipoprotein D and lipocalin family protein